MVDHEVNTVIRCQLLTQLKDIGLSISVISEYQPVEQYGKDSCVVFFPINETLRRWQGRNYRITGEEANHKEIQLAEKTIQVRGIVSESSDITSLDLTAIVLMIVNSLLFVDTLKKKGIGVQRDSDIRISYFANDKGDYKQYSSFDFNVTFYREILLNTSVIKALNADIYRI